VTGLPSSPAGAGEGFAPLASLSDRNGRSLEAARALLGSTVSLRGWTMPMPRRDSCLLSEGRVTLCQLCGDLHFDGASVVIHAAHDFSPVGVGQRLGFVGRLDIWNPPGRSFFEPQLRLVEAHLLTHSDD
jgi:hypothetical protein